MVRTHKTSSSWQSTGHCSAGYGLSGGANLKNETSKALLLSLIDLLPGPQKMEIHQTDAKSFVNRTRGTLKLGPALTGNRDIGCLRLMVGAANDVDCSSTSRFISSCSEVSSEPIRTQPS